MFLTPMPRARTDETLKFSNSIFFFCQQTVKKYSFLLKNVDHFVISAYKFEITVCALARLILNLKLFECFILDGPSPRFHQQR